MNDSNQIQLPLRSETIGLLESAIHAGDVENARSQLLKLLELEIGEPPTNIPEGVGHLAEIATSDHALNAAVLLRCLDVHGLIRPDDRRGLERPLVALVQKALPAVAKACHLEAKRQTFEKYDELALVHRRCLETLGEFEALQPDIEIIASSRQMLTRALNDNLIKAYCHPFSVARVRTGYELICNKLQSIRTSKSVEASDITDFRNSIDEQKRFCREVNNFLTKNVFSRFIEAADGAIAVYLEKVRGQFLAPLSFAVPANGSLQKRYPLHEEGRPLRIAIPLRNGGRGVASNVEVKIDADDNDLLFQSEHLILGSVPPGEFTVNFDAEVMRPSNMMQVLVTVAWSEVGQSDRKQIEQIFQISPQRTEIDWSAQKYKSPYSTAVAKGETFVGRRDLVQNLAGKILRSPMESFYITGQKRVGKTSLALAVVDFARTTFVEGEVFFREILWGSIANEDPRKSLAALGQRIAEGIMRELPAGTRLSEIKFDGSLSELVELAEQAERLMPKAKFVFVIDEFDEIHPELYQQGNLAETFFANIRAITNCDNICFILVGGENMPFVMDRQGQKLNKLSRVPLSYFSRSTEWEDFKELISRPTAGILDWHDEAMSEIFNVTNGNPFFAKKLCASVFEVAVSERDADITAQEVKAAILKEVSSFDTNAFSHLWQDGIHKPVLDREPDVQRRCRALVLISRVLRKGTNISSDTVVAERDGVAVSQNEIKSVLNDFVGRGVLKEASGQYQFVLPIFGQWLKEVGGSRLIADALGEELALRAQAADDAAYVQSNEIVDLAARWPTYRGQRISTEQIREWLDQVDSFQDQRLLFTLLENTKFFDEAEVSERLQAFFRKIRSDLPEFVIRRRSDRRKDVWVTYADGEGKSGQSYGVRFVEENKISARGILPPAAFTSEARKRLEGDERPATLVFIDDLVGTGKSLSKNLIRFFEANQDIIMELNIPVHIMILIATPEGEERIRDNIRKFEWLNFDITYGEMVSDRFEAFASGSGYWRNSDDRDRAKSLCEDLGVGIYPGNPLGFGDRGLTVVFPANCPNNSLPILHSPSVSGASKAWKPLFPRIIH